MGRGVGINSLAYSAATQRPMWYQGHREDGKRQPSEGTTSDSAIGGRHSCAHMVAHVVVWVRGCGERTTTPSPSAALFRGQQACGAEVHWLPPVLRRVAQGVSYPRAAAGAVARPDGRRMSVTL